MEKMDMCLFLITTLLITTHVSEELKFKCPSPCVCYLKKADCSNKGLTRIPESLHGDFTQLDLSSNKIPKISNNSFANFPLLKILHLSNSKISNLETGAFNGLDNLQYLSLENNNISVLQPGIFSPLRKIEELNLINYGFKFEKDYPDKLLKNLYHIRILKMTLIPDKVLGSGFSGLTKLHSLELRHKDFPQNSPRLVLPGSMFTVFKNISLKNLKISEDVAEIRPGCFSPLTSLQKLDLSDNAHLLEKNIVPAFSGLKNTKLQILHLNYTNRKTALTLDPVIFSDLKSLQELSISNSHIGDTERGFPKYLPDLKVLSIAENPLYSPHHILRDLIRMRHIKLINASYMFYPTTEINQKAHQKNIRNLFSATKYSKPQFVEMPPTPPISVPHSVETIILKHNSLRYTIPYAVLVGAQNVKLVDLSYNEFYNWTGPFLFYANASSSGVIFTTLEKLDLSHNQCSYVAPYFFRYSKGIKRLILNNNILGLSLANDTSGFIFRDATTLVELDLSTNQITHLAQMVFINQNVLTHLNLASNFISFVDFKLDNLTQLEHLDLSYNRLPYLNSTTCHTLDSIYHNKMKNTSATSSPGLTVNLLGNPLQCTCDAALKFLKWATTTEVILQNRSSYICTFKNGTTATLNDIDSIVLQLEKDCRSYTVLLITVSSTLALIIILAASITIYKKRWRLRFMWHKLKYRHQLKQGYQQLQGHDFQYDAFVSYAEEDEGFVKQYLVPILEEQSGFKLCLHNRDFRYGVSIQANILYSIQKSHKTLLLLTESFADSIWCNYEINIATEVQNDERRHLMIPILLKPIPKEKMTEVIYTLLMSTTYDEYPQDKDSQQLFWEMLKQYLNRQT